MVFFGVVYLEGGQAQLGQKAPKCCKTLLLSSIDRHCPLCSHESDEHYLENTTCRRPLNGPF